jgi:dCMP deaminase
VTRLLLYLPVIHAGYAAFLDRYPEADVLLLGDSIVADYPELAKEIRALRPDQARAYLSGPGDRRVRVVEKADLADLDGPLVAPDELIMRDLVATHHLADRTTFDRTFLRWDRSWSLPGRPAEFDGRIDRTDLASRIMRLAAGEAEHSSDWWRQVGAVAARDGEIIDVAHNEHQPTEYTPYLNGDPRNDFHRGDRTDLSTALHAEAAIVAAAARAGRSLAGADIYVTTFPCPACARLIAATGFARCYFAGPYAVLDGDAVLRAAGVELVWVDLGAG